MSWLKRITSPVVNALRPRARLLSAETLVPLGAGIAPASETTQAPITRTRTRMEVKSGNSLACDPCGGGTTIGSDPKWTFKLNLGTELPLSLWVYNCASLLAELAGSVRLEATFNGEHEPDSQLQRLLDKPAEGWRQNSWTTVRAYHLVLTGVDYLQIERATVRGRSATATTEEDGKTVKAGLPENLWPYMQGEYTTEVTDEEPIRIKGYKRTSDGALFNEADIIRTRFARPGDVSRGLPPLEAAASEALTDVNAAAWQAESYHNRTLPDGMMMFEDVLSQAQLDDANAHLQDGLSGAGNARKSFAMGSSMKGKWITLSRTAVEMDFINSRGQARDFICNAFGIPLDIFTPDATYANLENSRFMLWDQAVIPLVQLLTEGLNEELAPEFGPGWGVRANLDRVIAMLPLLRAKWDLAIKILAEGVPMDIVIEYLDLGLPSYAGSEIGFISSARQPVGIWSTQGGGPLPGDGGDA